MAEVKIKLVADSEEAAKKIREFAATLQGVGEEAEDASGWLGKLAGIDVSGAAAGWIKSIGQTNISFQTMHQILGDGIRLFSSFAQAAGEALAHAAESGDKSAQALIGGFERLKGIVDLLVGSFVKDFAPAILPLVKLFGDLAKQVAEWSAKSQGGATVAEGLIKILLVLGSAFTELVNVMVGGFKAIYDQYLTLGIALDQFTDQELVSMKKTMDGLSNFQNAWTETTTTVLDQLALISTGRMNLSQTEIDSLATEGAAKDKSAERDKERADEKKAAFDREVEALKEAANTSTDIMDTLKQATDEMVESDIAALGKEAAERKRLADVAAAAGKAQAAAAKQSAADQIKAAEDAQKKVVATYTKMFDLLKLAVTDWRAALSQALDLLTKAFIENLTKQAAATVSTSGTITTATGAQGKAFEGVVASASTAAIAGIPPKVANSVAGLGPIGLAILPGLIAAFLALARSKIGFEEGTQGSVQDSIAGLGRNDRGAYGLSPKEGVINEDGMNTRIGDIVGAINRGFGQGQNGGRQAAVPAKIIVELVYRGLPERSIIRQLMNLFNIEVRQFNGDLEATRLFG